MNKKSLISIALFALTSSLTFGSQGDGHAGGNGGDPILLRTKLIRQYINSDLRNDAQQFFKTISLDDISNVSAQQALKSMKVRGVATDIFDSVYNLKDSCFEVGGQVAGGAILNDRGGDICISPRRLAELNSSKAEIVGLIIHEHAHHFGYADKDYAIYKAVYQTVLLSSPDWNQGSGPVGDKPVPQPNPNLPGPKHSRAEAISVGAATSAERQLNTYARVLELAGRKIVEVVTDGENGVGHLMGLKFLHVALRNTSCRWSTIDIAVRDVLDLETKTRQRLDLLRINTQQLIDAEIHATSWTGSISEVRLYYCR